MNCVDAGNVLVHLFLQTKTHYELTNRKLQYLLIIAQMARLASGRTLYEDDIRCFKNGFVLDTIGNTFMSGAAIVSGQNKDMAIRYDASDFVLPFSKKKMFEIVKMPSEDDRKLLIHVFLAFGAFREDSLRRLLNEFRAVRNVPAYAVVEQKKVRSFLQWALKSEESLARNPVLQFIKEENKVVKKAGTSASPGASVREQKKQVVSKEPVKREPVKEEPKAEEKGDVPDTASSSAVTAPEDVAAPVVSPVAVAVVPRMVLAGIPSVQSIVAGKQYSVLVEVASSNCDCWVSVIAVDSQRELPVVREALSDTLYSFTFESVASDVRIRVHANR